MEDILDRAINEVVITSYDGDIDPTTGLYEGYGEAILDNASRYAGDFSRGLFHGQGKFTWADGSTYEGGFIRGKIHGKGVFIWSNGSKYEGCVEGGKRHGTGTFTSFDGQVYDGDWREGKRHGSGKMHYNADKSVLYVGEWRDGLRHGHGLMRYASGNSYEGEWEFDQKCGQGAMQWKDVDEVYMGQWRNDLPHGFGEHIWGDNGSRPSFKRQMCSIYRGEWVAGERSGLGTFFCADGAQYSGEWHGNQKDGSGVYIKADGGMHYGYYSQDRMLLTSSVPRETDAVTPQVRVNIADLMETFFYKSWNDKTVTDTTATIERLLLRYNSNLRAVLKRYVELANSRRKKDALVPLQSDSKIDVIFHAQRSIHKRFFTATLREFWRFAREFSLTGPFLSCYDIAIALEHLLKNRAAIARVTQLDQEATAARLAKEAEVAAELAAQQAAEAAAAAAAAKKNKKKGMKAMSSSGSSSSSSVPATTTTAVAGAAATAKALMSATMPAGATSTASLNKKSTKSLLSNKSGSVKSLSGSDSILPALPHSPIPLKSLHPAFCDCIYDESDTHPGALVTFDPRTPLRDYEFVELYVRCVVQSQIASAVFDGSFFGGNIDVGDMVYKSLAEQIYGRSADMGSIPSVYVDMYASHIQSSLNRHEANLKQLWGVVKELSIDKASGERLSTEEATVRGVLQLFVTMQQQQQPQESQASSSLPFKSVAVADTCTMIDMLRVSNKVPEGVDIESDPSMLASILSARVIYDDFIEMFIRLMRSEHWIHAAEKEREKQATDSLGNPSNTTDGQVVVAADVAASSSASIGDANSASGGVAVMTSEQLLTLRLHHLFAEMKSTSK